MLPQRALSQRSSDPKLVDTTHDVQEQQLVVLVRHIPAAAGAPHGTARHRSKDGRSVLWCRPTSNRTRARELLVLQGPWLQCWCRYSSGAGLQGTHAELKAGPARGACRITSG